MDTLAGAPPFHFRAVMVRTVSCSISIASWAGPVVDEYSVDSKRAGLSHPGKRNDRRIMLHFNRSGRNVASI